MRRADPRHILVFALVAAAAAAAVVVPKAGQTGAGLPISSGAASWRGLVGSRPQAVVGDRVIVVLRTSSLAQRVAAVGGSADIERERAWTNVAVSAQRLLLARLALHGVVVHPIYTFARVLNGFSAAIPPGALPILQADPDVAGIYPVRVAYPAALAEPGTGALPSAGLSLSGLDGRGVEIALVDTGVDPTAAPLRSHVMSGVDLVGGDPRALAASAPGDPALRERHGTEMAGLVVSVAPGAAVLPIRAAGWQPDSHGHWAIFARSDQLIAGLDRAVDPNADGDAHDAVRVALVALAEPFAAFADGAEALAVAGARRLDTLVVVPAGNDGTSTAAAYGDLSGPGGAPAALTVGALDTNDVVPRARAVVRVGLRTLLDTVVPSLGAPLPAHGLTLEVARGAPFTDSGFARQAGRATLVGSGSSPARAAHTAASAGATAVLLYGNQIPATGIRGSADVPVVEVPQAVARVAIESIGRGEPVSVALGPAGAAASSGAHVAPFSSSGLAFDGSVKPDVVAPGVALPTVDPGGDAVTADGSSAAAATVAGAAALLAQARPSLGADALAALLVGSADPLPGDAVTAQGAGAVDVGAAAASEVAASPSTLAFGASTGPGWRVRAAFTLTNLSTRALVVSLAIDTQSQGAAAVDFSLHPTRVVLPAGQSALVQISAVTASPAVGTQPAGGAVVARVVGGGTVRIPWAIAFESPVSLIRGVTLRRSGPRTGVVVVDAGSVARGIRPLKRLDVVLVRDGKPVGMLARFRDLLPGRYRIGLTGYGPAGRPLPAGDYVVQLVGYPVEGGQPNTAQVGFAVR
jgi:Subtilase family